MPDFEPRIIEEAARRLYDKAHAVLVGSVLIGGVLGAALGAVPLTSLGDTWPIPSTFGFATLLLGALVGVAVGYVIGDTRAFGVRLQAQSTLYQLQLERNTAATAKALAALAEAASARRPSAAPAEKPAPRPAPAPAPVPQLRPAAEAPRPVVPVPAPASFAPPKLAEPEPEPEPAGTRLAPPLSPPVSN